MALAIAAGRLLARRNLRRLQAAATWQLLGLPLDGRPAVLYFSTPGCTGCAEQRQVVDSLGPAVRVLAVDASERPDLAHAFGVLTAPTTFVFDARGRVLAANNGFAGRERLAGQLPPLPASEPGRERPQPARQARG